VQIANSEHYSESEIWCNGVCLLSIEVYAPEKKYEEFEDGDTEIVEGKHSTERGGTAYLTPCDRWL